MALELARRPTNAFGRDVAGAVAVIFALCIPALVITAGVALDYARLAAARTALQQAVDSAALSGAEELSIANMTHEQVSKSVEADVLASAGSLGVNLSASSSIPNSGGTVDVSASVTIPLTIMRLIGLDTEQVSAVAGASLEGETQLCALALESRGAGAFALTGSAKLTAPACSAYSNSTDPQGLQATGSTYLASGRTCTAGGYGGNGLNFSPLPWTGCPAHSDPLSDVVAPNPDAGNCIQTHSINASTTLSPGTYCTGLSINGSADVTLEPGVYIIPIGDFHVAGSATVTGANVSIYFSGLIGTFKADPQTTINLSASTTGSLAGILIYENRNALPGQDFHISSVNAHNLLGTIYIPVGDLTVDSAGPVADASAYTVIIAQKLAINGSANLTLNAMYTSTDVPVPNGLGPSGGTIALTQ